MMSGTATELAAIEAIVVSYLTAFNRHDAAAVVANYTDDGVLIAPIGPAVESKPMLAMVYPEVFKAVRFNMASGIRDARARERSGASPAITARAPEGNGATLRLRCPSAVVKLLLQG